MKVGIFLEDISQGAGMIASLFFVTVQIFSYFVFVLSENLLLLKIQEFLFLAFFLMVFLRAAAKTGIVSLYSIFLALCFVFNFGRFFLDLIGQFNILVGNFFGAYHFKAETISLNLLLMSFVLFFIDIGFYYSKDTKICPVDLSDDVTTKKIILLIMTICFPIDLYFSIKLVLYVKQYGYYALLHSLNQIPLSEKIIGYVFKLAFYTSFFFKFSKKHTIYIFALYFIDLLVHGLRGSRSQLLFPMFFYLYYLFCVRKCFKFSLKFFVVFLAAGLGFYIASSSTRGIFSSENVTLFKLIFGIILGQGTTSLLPLLYVDNFSEIIDSQIFSPAIITDFTSCYGLGSSLNLTEFITDNKENGLAINFLCEIYSAGIFGIPVCFLIGWFIKTIMLNLGKNKFFNTFFVIAGMSIPWMPRDNIFRVFYPTNVMFLIACPVFYLFLNFCGKYLLKFDCAKYNIGGGVQT